MTSDRGRAALEARRPGFIGRILVEQLERFWILRGALIYEGSFLVAGTISIPADLITDFGSVPRLLWWWVAPTDYELAPAFLLHDRCYESNEVSRRVADALLYEAAVACGTRRSKAWLIWLAVRCGGAGAYRTGPRRQHERLRAYGLLVDATP